MKFVGTSDTITGDNGKYKIKYDDTTSWIIFELPFEGQGEPIIEEVSLSVKCIGKVELYAVSPDMERELIDEKVCCVTLFLTILNAIFQFILFVWKFVVEADFQEVQSAL